MSKRLLALLFASSLFLVTSCLSDDPIVTDNTDSTSQDSTDNSTDSTNNGTDKKLSVSLSSSSSSVKTNASFTLTASVSGGSGKYDYRWKEGNGIWGSWKGSDRDTSITKSSASTYTFWVHVWDDGLNINDSASVTVTVQSDNTTDTSSNNTGTIGDSTQLNGNGIPDSRYYKHDNIKASLFWVGEGASDANHGISNVGSAWRGDWGGQYGVEDWAEMSRDYQGFPLDSRYKALENPYYFALPYNDMGALISDESGNEVIDFGITKTNDEWGRKKSSLTAAYWKDERSWPDYDVSMVKNRWVKITANGKSCYAQWEDAGPFFYNDTAYVFGSSRPINEQYESGYYNLGAGIDLSPAVMKYLTGDPSLGQTYVSWQFIDEANVPSGPWAKVITRSQMGGWSE